MSEKSYFRGTPRNPYHLSVGAVVMNNDGQICVHHFAHYNDLQDLYILMRETLHNSESIETAVERGLSEEFGVKAKIIEYLGSYISEFVLEGTQINKTTLYFLCRLLSQDLAKRDPNDEEKDSQIEWHDMDFLINKMRHQSSPLHKTDMDESKILESAKKYGVDR